MPARQSDGGNNSQPGGDAIFIETDVASEESTTAMAQTVLRKWGRIDGLVANAGSRIPSAGQLTIKSYVEDWDRMMQVNVAGPGCRAARSRRICSSASAEVL
jgi:NAD(P)-dependent dehydrogenase (short-subunit alcohol dehydrogenase family)